MTMLLNSHYSQENPQNRIQGANKKITEARDGKTRKHNYPKTRKKRTINYKKKIMNDDFIFEV